MSDALNHLVRERAMRIPNKLLRDGSSTPAALHGSFQADHVEGDHQNQVEGQDAAAEKKAEPGLTRPFISRVEDAAPTEGKGRCRNGHRQQHARDKNRHKPAC